MAIMSFDTYALYGGYKVAQDYYDYLIAAKRVHDAMAFHATFNILDSVDHVACRGEN